jgi:hypothetical protein
VNVAALQKHLRDLAEFLAAAGGGKAVTDGLNAIHEGLSPFAGERLEAFAAFLRQAEEYRRTGVLPVGKGKKADASAQPTAIGPAGEEVKRRVAALFGQARTATDEQIEAALAPLAKQFQLADLKAIADAADVGGKVVGLRAKDKVVGEIRRAIVDRRSMAQRSGQ